jgi:hypothetical protein
MSSSAVSGKTSSKLSGAASVFVPATHWIFELLAEWARLSICLPSGLPRSDDPDVHHVEPNTVNNIITFLLKVTDKGIKCMSGLKCTCGEPATACTFTLTALCLECDVCAMDSDSPSIYLEIANLLAVESRRIAAAGGAGSRVAAAASAAQAGPPAGRFEDFADLGGAPYEDEEQQINLVANYDGLCDLEGLCDPDIWGCPDDEVDV